MKNVTEIVLECHKEILMNNNIDMELSLDNPFVRESGIDSIGIVEFVMLLEEKLEIDMDEYLGEIRKCKTIRELVGVIEHIE